MSANANWARWIFASMATYLKQIAVAQQLPVMVEGLDERTSQFMEASDRVEIRITGPFTRELSRNYYELRIDVNVLISNRFDGPDKNRYTFARLAGVFHEAMDGAIAVYKYGDQLGDDETALVGCLSPLSGRNEAVRVFHFGQVNTTDGFTQSMVDARYVMHINDNETT
jgi:hypothetical protein